MDKVENGVKQETATTPPLTNLARQTREYRGDFVANYHPPARAELRHGPWRPAVYMQNWGGVHNWQTWTVLRQSNAPDATHIQIRDFSTNNTLAYRLWLTDKMARTPIPVDRYQLNPTALMPGNVRASS